MRPILQPIRCKNAFLMALNAAMLTFQNKSTRCAHARRTCVARVASPTRRTGAAESVTVVVAGPSVAAGVGVTLTLTWWDYRRTTVTHTRPRRPLTGTQTPPPGLPDVPGAVASVNMHINAVCATHGNGRSCPSSCRHTRSRSRSPGRGSGRRSYTVGVCIR